MGIPKLAVSLFAISTILTSLIGQTGSQTALPYLIKGVSFYINDDRVRYRDQPGLDGRILGVLGKQTEVVPIQVSDTKDDIDGNYPWYQCVIEPDRKATGWVFGKYISARLQLKDKVVSILRFRGRNQPEGDFLGLKDEQAEARYDLGLQFLYSFVDGKLTRQNGEALRSALPANLRYSVLAPDGQRELAKISISAMGSGMYPPAGAMLLSGAQAPQGFEDWIYQQASLSKSIILGNSQNYYDLPAQLATWAFQVLDNGNQSRSNFYYCHFVGMYRGWSLVLECFVVKLPNGSLVRTNLSKFAEKVDYTTRDSRMGYGALPLSDYIQSGIDFKDFPTTLVVLDENVYEGSRSDLYVTNGYIVYCLGACYEEGP